MLDRIRNRVKPFFRWNGRASSRDRRSSAPTVQQPKNPEFPSPLRRAGTVLYRTVGAPLSKKINRTVAFLLVRTYRTSNVVLWCLPYENGTYSAHAQSVGTAPKPNAPRAHSALNGTELLYRTVLCDGL